MAQQTVSIHYGLYALRQGRWVMDACFADEEEALAVAQRVRHAADVRGVRVLREMNLLGAQEPIVTVVYDSTRARETLVFKPAGDVEPRPQPAKPCARRRQPEPGLHLLDEHGVGTAAPSAANLRFGYAIGATGVAIAAAGILFALL